MCPLPGILGWSPVRETLILFRPWFKGSVALFLRRGRVHDSLNFNAFIPGRSKAASGASFHLTPASVSCPSHAPAQSSVSYSWLARRESCASDRPCHWLEEQSLQFQLLKEQALPWPAAQWLECRPCNEGSQVRFPGRAHTQVAGSIPGWLRHVYGATGCCSCLCLPPSL